MIAYARPNPSFDTSFDSSFESTNIRSLPAAGGAPSIAGKFATREEEAALVAAAQAGDLKARNLLIESNIGIIRNTARKFAWRRDRRESVEDWIGIVVEGWIQAIQNHDASLGVRLSTYARHYARKELQAFQTEYGSVIRVPRNVFNDKRNTQANREAAERTRRCLGTVANDDGEEVEWFVAPVEPEDDPHNILEEFRKAIERLPDRQRVVMQALATGMTLDQIAKRDGCSHQSIQQAADRAAANLRVMLGTREAFARLGRTRGRRDEEIARPAPSLACA